MQDWSSAYCSQPPGGASAISTYSCWFVCCSFCFSNDLTIIYSADMWQQMELWSCYSWRCGTHVGSGSSWMWSMRTSCRMQKRQRCCKDLTLLNLETGYKSWTGVGGRPEQHTQTFSCEVQTGEDRRCQGIGCLVTRDSGAQEVEELPVLGVHDGSFYELHHRVTTILKLRMTPQTEGSWRKHIELS